LGRLCIRWNIAPFLFSIGGKEAAIGIVKEVACPIPVSMPDTDFALDLELEPDDEFLLLELQMSVE
jgi:hypothetical protein